MAGKFEHQQNRDNLAKKLKETPEGKRRKVALQRARTTNEYGQAFQVHASGQIEAGTRIDLSSERADIYKSLENKIGNTSLTEIPNALSNGNRLFIKNEYENGVGHSHYDRAYIKLFKEKERLGIIKPGMDVFETTSGTAGVSFAAIGRELDYKCHVAIPAGGEGAREKAIEKEGAQIYLTPAKQYVLGFKPFIENFSKQHPDFVFMNHSMGNILGKGSDVNENVIETMEVIADEISAGLKAQGVLIPDFVLSALGNGTNTLGLARRFQSTDPDAHVVAYEMLSSGVGYSEKYGDDAYRRLLDQSGRFSAKNFGRHNMPGTSYPGIDFASIHEAIPLVDRVVLTTDAATEKEYRDLTGNELPEQVVRVKFGESSRYGRSTEAGIAVARELAKQEKGRNFVAICYDTIERYDSHIAILGGQGKFGAALKERLAKSTERPVVITSTVDKIHNQEIASQSDLVVLTVQPNEVESILREIAPSIKPNAQIVSFAAGCPLHYISEITGKPAARGMADPWWNVSAAVLGKDFSEENFQRVFGGLTNKATLRLETDKDMEDFTVAISYTFVVLLMKEMGTINNVDEHLEFIAPRIGVTKDEIGNFLPHDNPNELLALIATKGGISESIMQAIQSEPNIKPSDLFDQISKYS